MSIRSCAHKLYRRLLRRKESGGPVNQIEYWSPSRMLHKQDGYRHTTIKVTDKPVFHTDAWNRTEPWLPAPKDQRSDFLDPLCDWAGTYDTDEVQEWMKAMGIARQMKAEPEATEADCIAALKAADLDGEVYELEDFLLFYKEMRAILAHRPAEQPDQALVEELSKLDRPEACIGKGQYIPIHRDTLRRILAALSAPAGDAEELLEIMVTAFAGYAENPAQREAVNLADAYLTRQSEPAPEQAKAKLLGEALEKIVTLKNNAGQHDAIFDIAIGALEATGTPQQDEEPAPEGGSELADEPCWIWSNEHQAYWRPDGAGYTRRASEAGIYSRADAESRTNHCGPEKGIEIEPVPALRGQPDLLRLGTQAADAIRKAFFTSVSGGKPHRYHLSLAYPSMDEMHDAEDAIKAFVAALPGGGDQ